MKGRLFEKELLKLLYCREKLRAIKPDERRESSMRVKITKAIDGLLKQRGEAKIIDDDMARLTFCITRACQLRCTYCSVSKYTGHMPAETLERGIKLLMAQPQRDIEMHFIGGEPLLKFDLIRRSVKIGNLMSDRLNKRVYYSVSTNGLLMTQEMVDFFRAHQFHLSISLDGGEQIFGLQRPSVRGKNLFQKLRQNLDVLLKSGISYHITIVTTKESVSSLTENARCLFELGHQRIMINYHTGCYWPSASCDRLLAEMREVGNMAKANDELSFLNMLGESEWVEPHVLDPDLTLDIDGRFYPITVIMLERSLGIDLQDFALGSCALGENIDALRISPVDLLLMYMKNKTWKNDASRKIITNNIGIGLKIQDALSAKSQNINKGIFLKKRAGKYALAA